MIYLQALLKKLNKVSKKNYLNLMIKIKVFPGHGDNTNIGHEKINNAYFGKKCDFLIIQIYSMSILSIITRNKEKVYMNENEIQFTELLEKDKRSEQNKLFSLFKVCCWCSLPF